MHLSHYENTDSAIAPYRRPCGSYFASGMRSLRRVSESTAPDSTAVSGFKAGCAFMVGASPRICVTVGGGSIPFLESKASPGCGMESSVQSESATRLGFVASPFASVRMADAAQATTPRVGGPQVAGSRPRWFRAPAPGGQKNSRFKQLAEDLRHLDLHTVCEEAQCPKYACLLFCSNRFLLFVRPCSEVSHSDS